MKSYQYVKDSLKEGTLVAHKVFMTSREDVYRYGIVKFTVDNDHTFVLWCPCDDYPVSKNGGLYASPVKTGNLEVLNEIP